MQVWSQGEGRWQPGDDPNARLRWFDLTAADGDALAELGARFELHPLALEDCRSTLLHAPKLDDFGGYLFIILQGVQGTETTELDVFLGPDFLITYRDWEPSPPPESTTVAEALKSGQAVRPGVDGLFFEIADRLVDSVPPQLHVLGEQLDEIEGLVLSRQRAEQQAKILELRAAAGRIRRLLTPQLAVLQRLGRDDFKEVQQVNRMYFRDIYDHMVRIDLELEGIREDAEVALSTFLTAFNNRISDVMRVLTVVGALALPASVIASIFGTNFENVPLLHERWGFAAMIGSMLAVALMMAMYFKRKGWF